MVLHREYEVCWTVSTAFAAEQLASVSCFSEAVITVGVNLLTSLKRQRFCSHFSLPQLHSFFFRLHRQDITFPLTLSLHPIQPQICTGSASPLSLSPWNFLLNIHECAHIQQSEVFLCHVTESSR